MVVTKLRSSSMSLHGVFHKSRVFDPTCLFEAKSKHMIHQKFLFDSHIVNYADTEILTLGHQCKIIKFFTRVLLDEMDEMEMDERNIIVI